MFNHPEVRFKLDCVLNSAVRPEGSFSSSSCHCHQTWSNTVVKYWCTVRCLSLFWQARPQWRGFLFFMAITIESCQVDALFLWRWSLFRPVTVTNLPLSQVCYLCTTSVNNGCIYFAAKREKKWSALWHNCSDRLTLFVFNLWSAQWGHFTPWPLNPVRPRRCFDVIPTGRRWCAALTGSYWWFRPEITPELFVCLLHVVLALFPEMKVLAVFHLVLQPPWLNNPLTVLNQTKVLNLLYCTILCSVWRTQR